jgi:phage terminase small subunit
MPLTIKKQRFADAVMAGEPNMSAAIIAGYSAATASPAACRLAKDPDVLAYIARMNGAQQAAPASVDARAKAHGKQAIAVKEEQQQAAPPLTYADTSNDPKAFLLSVMNDKLMEWRQRIEAAKTLMPFTHMKLGEGGKKEQKTAAAERAAGGKFSVVPIRPKQTG